MSHDGRGADPLDDTVPRTTKPGTALPLAESWEASAQKIEERTFFGDPAANIATANTLRSCAVALRKAARSQPDEGRLRGALEQLATAAEEVDNCWTDEGDHIEWDADTLPERLIALRRSLAAADDIDYHNAAAPLAGETGPRLDEKAIAKAIYSVWPGLSQYEARRLIAALAANPLDAPWSDANGDEVERGDVTLP